MSRSAIVVHGGWPGHEPQAQVERMLPFLTDAGFDVDVHDSTAVYADAERMSSADLVLQQWTMGEIAAAEVAGLRSAVAAGTGFAGWHGGIVDAFRSTPAYLQLTGAQFVDHPGGVIDYEVEVVPAHAGHPIVAGLDRFAVRSEQYWVLSDALNTVLAETVVAADPSAPWARPVRVPVLWTREWGRGRVFVSTIGHTTSDLDQTEVRTTIERGLQWASR